MDIKLDILSYCRKEEFTVEIELSDYNGTDVDVRTKINVFFIDGKFSKCEYPFKCPYSFEQWAVLGTIAKMIERLQKRVDELNYPDGIDLKHSKQKQEDAEN